ncbi:polysaccharide deacetylase [Pirellula staleyi DSM 6068]|uniref:Polysaccharide deacetylase n=1 Tax=Pirellula staleyi (strain ATCC 27377 / DSM 6068 / ICPB 4128) TaxID=530564 RepID=D2R111_PIRSD|nr:polysaccharide deacetylase family protein [Pirellula staleyi]ADB18496.1 polysaccharide deacetylase [Pirellula staleyi DSM 6068]
MSLSTEDTPTESTESATNAAASASPPAPAKFRGDQHFGLRQRLKSEAGRVLHQLLGVRHRQALGVLMYHRISSCPNAVIDPTWNVTPRMLRLQLEGLLKRGFRAWPLQRVLDYHRRGQPIPRTVFVVTFDDGYENNFTEAFPILCELEVPATIFLATAYLDTQDPFPSDDWELAGDDAQPIDSWRPLSTDQCREMQRSGLIELAAHTHTHADFRGRPDALYEDLLINQQVLAERFGITEATFAFPYGTRSTGFSGPLLAGAVKAAGLSCALTTESELVFPTSDPFDWGRFTAEEHDTPSMLASKLSGWYTAIRKLGRTLLGRPATPVAIGS